MERCTHPGCSYQAKTKGAITAHVRREHGDDPIAKIRNSIGAGAPVPGGAFRTDRPLTAMPSGIPSVDYAIGIGGVPRGTIIEVFGPAASGKTLQALTFSAHAQQNGMRAGYMDAERALQPTFAALVPGLDLEALEYGQPPGYPGDDPPWDGTGEAALEASRRYIDTGEFAVWTVDSVAQCVPREEQNLALGDSRAQAAQARMFRSALRVLTPVVEKTECVLVFVNHMTDIPNPGFGRKWSRPVAKAFDYYASVQLKVEATVPYYNKDSRKIGHRVRVKVHKSKVAAPHAQAEYDLFYRDDLRIGKDGKYSTKHVHTGVDIASAWFGVLKAEGAVASSGGRYVSVPAGQKLGTEDECLEMLGDPDSELSKVARGIVYPEAYRHAA